MSLTTEINLVRTRGDTRPITFSIDLNGSDMPITGATFLMTIDPAPDPPDNTTLILQLSGAIVGNAALGVIAFSPDAAEMDIDPDTYYFDVQMTESNGKITTIARGKFTIVQDITK